jgi:DnaJ-class molecular chaperone
MHREEALEILGFKPNSNPSKREITIAYRRLAPKVHPDKQLTFTHNFERSLCEA